MSGLIVHYFMEVKFTPLTKSLEMEKWIMKTFFKEDWSMTFISTSLAVGVIFTHTVGSTA